MAIGVVLGMIAGYGPRWADNALLLLFDTVRSFPTIVLALAIVSLTGPSLEMVMVVFIINAVPGFGRIARTQTLALKSTEFILAERSLGAGPWRSMGTLLFEGRFSLLTAVLAGFGRAIAEVGAASIVGGNIAHLTRVMTTTIKLETNRGDLPLALALGIILVALSILINAAAHLAQEAVRSAEA